MRYPFADTFARFGRALGDLATATASATSSWPWPWPTHEYRAGGDRDAVEALRGMAEILTVMERFLEALEDARRRARLRERLRDAGWPEPAVFVQVQPTVVRRPWRRWKQREAGRPSWARAGR